MLTQAFTPAQLPGLDVGPEGAEVDEDELEGVEECEGDEVGEDVGEDV